MSHSRFEDRLTGKARVLSGLLRRVTARSAAELPDAFREIAQAQAAGHWVALLLDYELGEWLEPALQRTAAPITQIKAGPQGAEASTVLTETAPTNPSTSRAKASPLPRSRLTALVFERATLEEPWQALPFEDDNGAILSATPNLSQADYLQRVEQIKQWIANGEVYQINTTFSLAVVTQGNAQHLYRQLANQHPSAHAAFIEDEDCTVLSFSPELFLRREHTTLSTRPMKGTAPRSSDPQEDRRLGEHLQTSEKDRAENLMIVDLLRNDLGRIAEPGSVIAGPLFSLVAYPSVWTLTSTVRATIAPTTTFEQILRALFPCGSITGAPKIAAMKRIQQTEPHPRELYCGSIGWLAPTGDFSLSVAIRTLVLGQNGTGRYQVGGGIVHDSVAEKEWDECHWKARIIINQRADK